MTTVIPQNGYYLVTVVNNSGVHVYTVYRDKTCTCGRRNCEHVRAVREYLRNGGTRAGEPTPLITSCPICGAPVTRKRHWPRHWWACTEDPAHYFRWRGEVGGIREFLTDPNHPSKHIQAFYEPGREEWLRGLERPPY